MESDRDLKSQIFWSHWMRLSVGGPQVTLLYQQWEAPSETEASATWMSFQLIRGPQLWCTSKSSAELQTSDVWASSRSPYLCESWIKSWKSAFIFCKKEMHLIYWFIKVQDSFHCQRTWILTSSLAFAASQPHCWASASFYFFKCRMCTNIPPLAPFSEVICVKPLCSVPEINIIEHAIQGLLTRSQLWPRAVPGPRCRTEEMQEILAVWLLGWQKLLSSVNNYLLLAFWSHLVMSYLCSSKTPCLESINSSAGKSSFPRVLKAVLRHWVLASLLSLLLCFQNRYMVYFFNYFHR